MLLVEQNALMALARTFQNVEVFPAMTVVENLLLGRYRHMRAGILTGALWAGRAAREEVAQDPAVVAAYLGGSGEEAERP